MDPLGCQHEDTGGFPHEVSATDTWCMLVGSCLLCRDASAIWFVNHWWYLTSSMLISIWPCCRPGGWTLEYQHMMLCIWWWIHMKAESQWPAGEDHWATLATSGSTRSRRMPTPYRYLRSGDLRLPGVTEWHSGPLGLCDNDDNYYYSHVFIAWLNSAGSLQICSISDSKLSLNCTH